MVQLEENSELYLFWAFLPVFHEENGYLVVPVNFGQAGMSILFNTSFHAFATAEALKKF